MKRLILITFAIVFLAGVAHAQTTEACPKEYVCLSPSAARAALEAGDKAKALTAEIAVREKAYADLKDELANIRIEFARASGENTILKQRAVSDAALIELLVKMARKKSVGLINLF